jgi:5-deoxy-glucuronate isomerase
LKAIFFDKTKPKEGFTLLVSKDNSYLNDLEVGRLRLGNNGDHFSGETQNEELLLEILIGSCDITTTLHGDMKKFANLGNRKSVFDSKPDSILIGPHTTFHITCTSESTDILMPKVVLHEESSGYNPVVIKSNNVQVYEIGQGNYKRTVRVILGGNGPAKRLRGGETINDKGQWSSWPRHSFDDHPELAKEFEEFFLYFTNPKDGYALQRADGTFSDGEFREQTQLVRNGDYAILPLGDHPIVAAPDTKVLYVWFYISPIPKIYPKWAEDHGEYA